MRPLRLLPCLAVALAATVLSAAESKRPNVLLICVDDLKPLLGCYGDKLVQSPAIDRLAGRGLLFERAYCNQAVCSPSRNALMTGLRSTTLGIYDLPTNFRVAAPNAESVAQHFRAHGWRTEGLGKIFHTGHGNHEDEASWTVPHWRPKTSNFADSKHNNDPVENADVPDSTYADGQIADEAIRRLQQARKKPQEPFFLAVGFLKPHLPFCAPKKYWDLYQRSAFPLPTVTTPPEGAPAYAPTSWGELRKYNDMPSVGPLNEAQQRELIHGYHAAVSYMDAQLGRVTAELERLGLAGNTIVVLWGDHGWHLGDHGQWCKHTNYEEAAHIPFVVVAPGVTRPGSRTRALVESVDLFPTLAELAGLPAPAGAQRLDGRSFVSTLRDPQAATKEAVFHCYPRTRPGVGNVIGRAVRTARHRLVEWKAPGAPAASAEYELYDYEADPLETRNLAATQPAVVARLRTWLDGQPEARPQVKPAAVGAAPEKTAKKKKKKKV